MPTLCAAIDASVALRELDRAPLARCAFWTETLGIRELSAIIQIDVDAALVRLGCLLPRRDKETRWARRRAAG
jgi:hypothetical protein